MRGRRTSGTAVSLADDSTATPSFTAPFVAAGGEDLTFELTVNDGYGGNATDSVVVHIQNANDPPLVSAAEPSKSILWPPNHGLVSVGIVGVSDPDNNATITIDSVTQDEPTNGQGDGDTEIDAFINPDGTVLIRVERSGNGNGRVYHIHFTVSDLEGSASGVVTVSVPHKKKDTAIDGGELFLLIRRIIQIRPVPFRDAESAFRRRQILCRPNVLRQKHRRLIVRPNYRQ